MKTDLQMAVWLALLAFTSCANDDEVSLVNHEKFYMNLSWGDSEIVITDQEYQLTTAGSTNVCGVNLVNEQFSDEQYVYGIKELGMEDLDENNFATAIHLYVSKKIYIEGSFRVNLFKGHYGTESEMVAGEFRWPVRAVRTSALLNLCN